MKNLIFHLMLCALSIRYSHANKQMLANYKQSCQWLELVEENVSSEFGSVYHLMIFQFDNVRRPAYSNIFQFLSQRHPVMTYNSLERNMDMYYLSGDVVVNIFIYHDNNSLIDVMYAIFAMYTKNHKGFRPKSLLFFFYDGVYSWNLLYFLREFWWNYHYLNVTIITVNLSHMYPVPVMHRYNPFMNIYQTQRFPTDLPVFPDKLADMGGIQIRAHVPDYIRTNHNGQLVSHFNRNKSFLPMLSILMMKHNMSVELMRNIFFVKRYLKKRWLHIELKGGVVEPKDFQILPTLYTYSDCPQIMGVVPIIQRRSLGNIYNVIINISTILVVIIIMTHVRRFCFGADQYWSMMNVSEMVIGGSTLEEPRTLTQKIMFICFAFISMKYSSDFYSEFVDLKIIHDTLPFETFEDIINSKLPIYTYGQLKDVVLEEDTNPYIDDLRKKIRLFDNNTYVRFCLLKLRQKKDRICLALRGEIDRSGGFNEKTMKLTDPGFPCRQVSYHMGYGLVYHAPLFMGILRLTEAGINQYVLREHNNIVAKFDSDVHELRKKLLKLENNDKQEIPILNNIIAICLTSGYLLSFVCFVGELFIKIWNIQLPFEII